MGLFDKKYCDICGGSMGLIIDNKAADGNYCHTCARKLSPFFNGGKKATLQEISQQIAYREQNKQQLDIFNPTKIMGYKTKVYVDPAHNCFVVSSKSDYKTENADIINLSTVLGVTSDVKEHKKELFTKDASGKSVSYTPKRYEYKYEIIVTINVNHPYFKKIEFEVTKDRPDSKTSQEFFKYQQAANEIISVLTGQPMAAVSNPAGNIAQAVTGLTGVAAIGAALLGSQGNAQQGFNNNQGYVQQGFNNNQGYAQQGFNANQGYAQQGFNANQGYAQQGFNANQGYAQQNFNANQGFAQQGFNTNQGFAQQGFNNNQAFGGQWICPNCGTANAANFCQNCGTPKN